MKVSVNWVKQFTDIELPIDKLVEKIGAQLGAVEEVIDIGKRYQGIIVARVITSDRHPNSDKLTVCKIDDGGVVKKVSRDTQGYAQVVCGAPNVEIGMLTAWIPPGVTVPSTFDKEPLVIEAKEIRGVVSHGMLASPKELGFGGDHSGLLAIDEDIIPGTSFTKAYKLDDHIIDIENKMFTHRPDLFGMLGIAREISGIQNTAFHSPSWYLNPKLIDAQSTTAQLNLQVKNDLPRLVPRFCALSIANVSVGPSPVWLQSYLMRVGIRPVNNVVDLTNFVMYETGQPLHAYDYDKLAGGSLVIRYPKEGEGLTVLGGKNLSLHKGTIIIADAVKAVGLGGVMGGAGTEVDDDTKNIVLECANFDMNAVRNAAMEYGLFTDAATRFTKNQSPLQNPAVITKAAEDILRLAGGNLASPLIDDKSKLPQLQRINTSSDFVNLRLGLKLSSAQMAALLNNVEVETKPSGSKFSSNVPFWRTDLAIPEDIVEEIGRLYGYDHLPQELPPRDLTPAKLDPSISFKSRVRRTLSSAGANEVLTYSFVHESLLKKVGQDPKNAYHIRNALSPDLQYYRLSIIPSLLEKVQPNIRAGFGEFALFEIGKEHFKGATDRDGLPKELDRIAVVVASKDAKPGAPYFAARKICDYLLDELGIGGVFYEPIDRQKTSKTATYYDSDRTALITVNGQKIGRVGEFKQSVSSALKLPRYCAGFALHSNKLVNLSSPPSYQSINRFPSLDQDLCLRSTTKLTYAALLEFLKKQLDKASAKHGYGFDIFPLDIFQRPKDKSYKQTTWRIRLWHPGRTLTTAEVNELIDQLSKEAKNRLKAARV